MAMAGTSTGSAGAAQATTGRRPTLVLPREWSVPGYLLHSSFSDRFVVGGGNTAGPSGPATTSASNASTNVTINANAKGKQRDVSSSSGGNAIHLPSKLDPKHCCKRLLISDDYGLQFMAERDEHGRESASLSPCGDTEWLTERVVETNTRESDKDAAAVRADYPIPPQAGIYYFEMTVVSRGQKGYIGIGFCTRAVDLERLPGWNNESYGYHGDDGKAFACSGTGHTYGPKFGAGDVIGCGIDFISKRAFFCKNGTWLGYVFDLSSDLRERKDSRSASEPRPGLKFYPTIGLQTPGESVTLNFGQEPFAFDIDGFVRRRKHEQTEAILTSPIPRSLPQALAPLPSNSVLLQPGSAEFDQHVRLAMSELVAGYLSHRGYSDTARALKTQQCQEAQVWNALLAPSSSSATAAAAKEGDTPSEAPSKPPTPVPGLKKRKKKDGDGRTMRSALRTTISKESLGDEGDMDIESSDAPPILASGQATPLNVEDSRRFVASASGALNVTTSDESAAAEMQDVQRRQAICRAVQSGDVDFAMREISLHFPDTYSAADKTHRAATTEDAWDDHGLSEERVPLRFRLECQKFVELLLETQEAEAESGGGEAMDEDAQEDEQVASELLGSVSPTNSSFKGSSKGKREAVSMDDVLEYGAKLSTDLVGMEHGSPKASASCAKHLKTVFSLVAYTDPRHVPGEIGLLCSQAARDALAEELNSAMLESQGKPGRPVLEMVYRQAHAASRVLGDRFSEGRAALMGDVLGL